MKLCLAHGGDVSRPSGGADRVTAIAAGLGDAGADVTLVVPEPADPLPDRLDGVAVRTVAVPASNPLVRAGAVAAAARRVARRTGARLQYEHSALAGVGGLGPDHEYVLDMHDVAHPRFDHVDSPLSPVLRRGVAWLEGRAVRRASHVFAVSTDMAALLRERWNVSRADVTVVPNGYFPGRVAAADADVVPGRVAFLGTLHPKVDVEALVAAADLDDVSEVVVVGDGARREALEAASGERGAGDLRVLGRRPDAEAFDLVASAAAVVNPQRRSALQRTSSPVKLYYYAALGKPVVATAGPAVVADLADRDAALAVASRAEFLDALREVLRDDALAARLSANAAEAAKDFRWERRIEPMWDVHRTLRTGASTDRGGQTR